MRAFALLAPRVVARLRGRRPPFARFGHATQGVAAVEFALVLPVMALIYLGLSEMSAAVNTDRKLTILSRTLADLTGRSPRTVDSAGVQTIFLAATSVMAPYKSDQAKMVISSIVVKATGQMDPQNKPILDGTVCWSRAAGPSPAPLPAGAKVPVPDGFGTANTSFIRADVEMAYAPLLGAGILKEVTGRDSLTLGEKTPWPVRNVSEVVMSGTPACLP